VIGFDINEQRVREYEGEQVINYLDPAEASGAIAKGQSNHDGLRAAGRTRAIMICVPTPLTANRDPDLSVTSRLTVERIRRKPFRPAS